MRARLRRLIQVAVVGFVVLTGAAMWAYPGGHVFQTQAPGHHLLYNFLCDLMDPRAINGQPNLVSSTLMVSAFCVVYFLGLLPSWWCVPSLFSRRRWVVWMVRGAGVLSLLGIFALFLSGVGSLAISHDLATFLAAIPGIVATFMVVAITVRDRLTTWWFSLSSAAMLLAATLDALLYLRVVWFEDALTPIVPALQRVAMVLILVWLLQLAREVRPEEEQQTDPRS